jgi:Fe-S cluster assembly protein SufD
MILFVNGAELDSQSQEYVLRLPKGIRQDHPIHVLHLQTRYQNGACPSPRLIILAEEDSQATIIESFYGFDDTLYYQQSMTHIQLSEHAKVHYYKCQNEGDRAIHTAHISAVQRHQSYLATAHVVMGAMVSQDYLSYRLLGEGATCESLGFYHSHCQQQLSIQSNIYHSASYTNSRQLFKGVAADQSMTNFSGKINVPANVKEICAYQTNNNLLLSSQAVAKTHPELEIYSDDVRCSHGATVGQLDDDTLFYLQSRGICRDDAQNLLKDGFANEVFDAFPDQDVLQLIKSRQFCAKGYGMAGEGHE